MNPEINIEDSYDLSTPNRVYAFNDPAEPTFYVIYKNAEGEDCLARLIRGNSFASPRAAIEDAISRKN